MGLVEVVDIINIADIIDILQIYYRHIADILPQITVDCGGKQQIIIKGKG